MTGKISALVFILAAIFVISAPASEVLPPTGTMPEVDGVISVWEWEDSLNLPIEGGKGLWLKQSGEYLCIAIRGANGGIGSIGLSRGDSLRVLHASTGLITAEYAKSASSWTTKMGFRGPEVEPGVEYSRGSVRQGVEYREANLAQFGWTANVVELGPAEDMEFVVKMGRPTGHFIRLSVVFFQIKATKKYAVAPAGLSDALLDRALVAGTANTELGFKPNQWLAVVW